MGTFGEGNFDSDGALDYVNDLVNRLAATVTQCLADEDRSALDEEGETIVVPSVDIIALLCAHCSAVPPKEELVIQWRERYLRLYDEQIDALDPKAGYKVKRRAVIEQTFDRLVHLAYLGIDGTDEKPALP